MNNTLATTRFWLIRHAPVRAHQGVVYGQTDWECICDDPVALDWLVQHLPTRAVHVSSSLQRTKQTAEALYRQGLAGSLSHCLATLNEQSFGAWEGMRYAELAQQDQAQANNFWWAPARTRAPDSQNLRGESFVDLCRRVQQAQKEILHYYSGQDVVVFTHGGTIRAFLALAQGMVNPILENALDSDSENFSDAQGYDGLEGIFAIQIDNLSLTRLNHVQYQPDDSQTPRDYWRIGLINAQHNMAVRA